MLLSRGINFYLFVLISGVVSLYFSLKKEVIFKLQFNGLNYRGV